MAVYLITIHAYRSWLPDHPRGYVQRKRGIQRSDPEQAAAYTRRAKHERRRFDDAMCRALVEASRQAATRWDWRWHAAVAVWSHVHVQVSWETFVEGKAARQLLKRHLTEHMNEAYGDDHPWFSRAGSVKRVVDRDHFDRLVYEYLPSHKKYGGWFDAENRGLR